MKLYTAPTLSSQILASLGSTYLIYAFTGEVPASIDDVSFDFNDVPSLSNSASSITEVTAAEYEGSLRFLNSKTLKRPKGHYFNRVVGKTQLLPSSLTLSENQLEDLTVAELASQFSLGDSIAFQNPIAEGDYVDFDFGKEVNIDQLYISHHSSASYRIETYELLREVEGEWVSCEQFTMVPNSLRSSVADVILSAEYTASKFRLVSKESSPSYRYSAGVEFFGTTLPTEETVAEDITWFMLRPNVMTTTFGSEDPMILGDAGGPNSNKEVAFSHYDTESGAEIKLLNFKLQSKVIGEANA